MSENAHRAGRRGREENRIKSVPLKDVAFYEEWHRRFWGKIIPEPNSGCWLWNATCNDQGYGQFWLKGKLRYAHRVAYRLFNGDIPSDLEIDHLCRVRCCCNPAHLEAVTASENQKRGIASKVSSELEVAGKYQRSKTHCPQGHPYSGENLALHANGKWRRCKECARQNARRQHRKKKYRQLETKYARAQV